MLGRQVVSKPVLINISAGTITDIAVAAKLSCKVTVSTVLSNTL